MSLKNRFKQRYQNGSRLLAGYEQDDGNYKPKKILEVLMINSISETGLLFPKGGWENDESVEEAAVREAIEEAGVRGEIMEFLGNYHGETGKCTSMFALQVKEELISWPEQNSRRRIWLAIPEAQKQCQRAWMNDALVHGFLKWHQTGVN
ncbi:Nudix hydrolase 13 [Zostera marina]|uniref:Nudix hydrolase 13 n=1 Tax=Zostera marina TaxID=29655 RepID=A0A0K9P9B4_ZOSMR|nr:Nudix hydrolase 13 [Zostera marina]